MRRVQKRGKESLDNICFLISGKLESDKAGNIVNSEPLERMIYCAEIESYNSDRSAAGQMGVVLSAILVADQEEYNGEQNIRYSKDVYTVYQTHLRTDGKIEIFLKQEGGTNIS